LKLSFLYLAEWIHSVLLVESAEIS